jgi:hypothetical protein
LDDHLWKYYMLRIKDTCHLVATYYWVVCLLISYVLVGASSLAAVEHGIVSFLTCCQKVSKFSFLFICRSTHELKLFVCVCEERMSPSETNLCPLLN